MCIRDSPSSAQLSSASASSSTPVTARVSAPSSGDMRLRMPDFQGMERRTEGGPTPATPAPPPRPQGPQAALPPS
eukprot:6030528-Alexandrium_andersonii.AAC.1